MQFFFLEKKMYILIKKIYIIYTRVTNINRSFSLYFFGGKKNLKKEKIFNAGIALVM